MKDFNLPSKSRIVSVLIIVAFIIALLVIKNKSDINAPYQRNSFSLNTAISITIYDNIKANDANVILDECMAIISNYENLFSKTIPDSDVSKINDPNNKSVVVSDETADLLTKSLYFAQISDGAVDPTVGALSSLWDITGEAKTPPTDSEILSALKNVNYKDLVIDENTVTKLNDNIKVDLGFIAKGYIADRLKEYLIESNIKSAIINLGGNVLCIGTKPDGSSFKIGIQDPLKRSDYITSLEVIDSTLVSSGNYERFFEYNQKKYHHILSTETGYPVDSGLSQVTIICNDSTTADALSTLCFILGYDKATKFLSEYYPDVQAIFVDINGNIL